MKENFVYILIIILIASIVMISVVHESTVQNVGLANNAVGQDYQSNSTNNSMTGNVAYQDYGHG